MTNCTEEYTRDIERFKSYFRHYMLVSSFREETFLLSPCMKDKAKILAELGYYNVKCKSSNFLNFKISCAFCAFVYESKKDALNKIQFFKFTDCQEKHANESPVCPMITKNEDFSVSFGANIVSGGDDKLLNVQHHYEGENNIIPSTLSATTNSEDKGFTCCICVDKQQNVQLYPCAHTLCGLCLLRISSTDHCPQCRREIKAFGEILFP
jgi:C3HC4-type zinc finger (RING finger) protein